MRFFSTLAAVALATVATAQNVALSSIPASFTIGKPSTISWSGGNGGAVTLILREGSPDSLNTIGIIGSNLKGNNFTWTPSSSLKPADDYALQITQGLDGNNYSGLFSILEAASSSGTTTIFAAVGGVTSAIATVTANATTTSSSIRGTASGTGNLTPANTTMMTPTLRASSSTSVTTSVSTTTSGTSSTSTGGAMAQVTAQAVMGLGAVLAAGMYLL